MLTSNAQLGYQLASGGGEGGGTSCPGQFILPRISERMDNSQILLYHLLQEYLVERAINLISVNLRCLLQTFSWVMYYQGMWSWGGGQAVQGGLSAPRPPPPPAQNFRENGLSPNFITPSTAGIFS